MYKVFDIYGNYLRSFDTYQAAFTWKVCVMGRPEWTIKYKY